MSPKKAIEKDPYADRVYGLVSSYEKDPEKSEDYVASWHTC